MQNSGPNVDGSKARGSLQMAENGNNTDHVVTASGVSLDVARFVDQFCESTQENNNNTTSKNSATRPALNGYNNDEDNKNNINDNNVFSITVDTKATNCLYNHNYNYEETCNSSTSTME